jgi:hypothetical protein
MECCLKGIWVHPYTIPLAKLAPDLEILCGLWSGNDAITPCLCGLWSGNDAITPWLTLASTSNCFPHPY